MQINFSQNQQHYFFFFFDKKTNNITIVLLNYMYTPRRNAVPLRRQSSANIFVAFRASCMLLPEAITAHTMAPAEEPANGVVSCIMEKQTTSFHEKNGNK